MSNLDIAERRMPQDGKIKMRYGGKKIEYRVATCPTVGGNEDAVLRILAASKPIPLDEMNFSDRNLNLIQESAAKPYGLKLVVPIGFISICRFLFKRIKSNRLKPRIN